MSCISKSKDIVENLVKYYEEMRNCLQKHLKCHEKADNAHVTYSLLCTRRMYLRQGVMSEGRLPSFGSSWQPSLPPWPHSCRRNPRWKEATRLRRKSYWFVNNDVKMICADWEICVWIWVIVTTEPTALKYSWMYVCLFLSYTGNIQHESD